MTEKMIVKKRASLDRIEEGLLVLYTEDDRLYTLSAEKFSDFKGGETVELSIDGETPISVAHLEEETEKNKKKNRSLFSSLFFKKKR